MSSWRRIENHGELRGFECGWRGLWRHFVAVLRGREPVLEPYEVRVSCYAKGDEALIDMVQSEARRK